MASVEDSTRRNYYTYIKRYREWATNRALDPNVLNSQTLKWYLLYLDKSKASYSIIKQTKAALSLYRKVLNIEVDPFTDVTSAVYKGVLKRASKERKHRKRCDALPPAAIASLIAR